jgi:hypothetical protein
MVRRGSTVRVRQRALSAEDSHLGPWPTATLGRGNGLRSSGYLHYFMVDTAFLLHPVAGEERCATASATRSATASASSCSQALRTSHPSRLSCSEFRASRARFSSIFGPQYCALVRGRVPCSGQPCQKQPSTNSATRRFGNTTSARTGRCPGTRMGRSTRNRKPRLCNADRTASSVRVSRRRFDIMIRRRSSGTPAHGARDERGGE